MFKIDEYHMIVRNNFQESDYTLIGLLQNTIIKVVLIHDSLIKNNSHLMW